MKLLLHLKRMMFALVLLSATVFGDQLQVVPIPNSTFGFGPGGAYIYGNVFEATNDSGELVGYQGGFGPLQGLIRFSSGVQQLVVYPGATNTLFTTINDAGVIGGSTGSQAFLYQNGAFQSLVVPGAVSISVNAINNENQVVGSFSTAGGSTESFVEDQGNVVTFGLPNYSETTAVGINDQGLIMGTASNPDGIGTEWFTANAQGQIISVQGAPSSPSGFFSLSGFNDAGTLIGGDGFEGYVQFPDGSSQILAINGATGFRSIDNAGTIVGYDFGISSGESFLATTTSAAVALEPGGLGVFASGVGVLIMLVGRAR